MAKVGKKEAAIAALQPAIDAARHERLAQSDLNTPARNAQLTQTIRDGEAEQLRIAGAKTK